ncbi:putative zinc finger protein [Moniliophthora roreri MCA 2997]|uniref:Zinc finger protein n=1 Tax=Moniliophthora roreri (strain MCA 2997) TaxID=1381753 RepID=V2WDT6_MONRO|nr:putative zinc finger protein [Moniliophthora roreri MCA 2997]
MQDKQKQHDYRFDAEWQHPEDFTPHPASSSPYSDFLIHHHEPSYPFSRTGPAMPSPFWRTSLSQDSSWNNHSVAALDFLHSQTPLEGPSAAAYRYMGPFDPGSCYGPVKMTTGSPHLSQLYDATGRLTFPTSSGSDNWYSVTTSLLPSTSDPAEPEDFPDPSTKPRYKQVVASESVVDASMRRRKPTEKGRKIYSCTKFPPCTQTFTAGHNLKNHERSHRGERPFKCGFCPVKTVTCSDIKRHEEKCKFSTVISGPLQTL